MRLHDEFLESDLPAFEPDGKVGLLATVNDDGLPHVTLITAMRAPDTRTLVFGQFCEGLGKENAERNGKTGFLIMGFDRVLWRGRADWRKKEQTGAEFDVFNSKPMWRYNSYFGIHTVHYLDLAGTGRAEKLPAVGIAAGIIKSIFAGRRGGSGQEVLNRWSERLISRTGNLKFISYIGRDGYPEIIPCLSAAATDRGRVYIPGTEYGREVSMIPDGSPLCLFVMSLDMEDVLVRGRFRKKGAGGSIDLDWVYNPMPPLAKQIYPLEPANLKVESFV